MRIVRSRLFEDSLRTLARTDPDLFEAAASDIGYLLDQKRAATLPQVRWGIARSRHSEVMGEVRTHLPGDTAFIRVLFAMPQDEGICAFLVMGDKSSPEGAVGNDWYDQAVPLADEMWEALTARFELGTGRESD